MLNLASNQAFAYDGSVETLKDKTKKKESGGQKKKKSDSSKGRCKSKRSETKCTPGCKGRPNVVESYYPDGIDVDDRLIELPQESFHPEMLTKPASITFQDE